MDIKGNVNKTSISVSGSTGGNVQDVNTNSKLCDFSKNKVCNFCESCATYPDLRIKGKPWSFEMD